MKTKAMLINDLKYGHIKELVRQRIGMYSHLTQASDIFVYPDYNWGWHAVFGVYDSEKGEFEVNVIYCVWGRLEWETGHRPIGFLPSGAVRVNYRLSEGDLKNG